MNVLHPQGSRLHEAAFSLRELQSPDELAALFGVTLPVLEQWCSQGIPDEHVPHCAARLGCDELWLLMGIGDMTGIARDPDDSAIVRHFDFNLRSLEHPSWSWIRLARESCQMSLENFASALEVDVPTLAQWESGTGSPPHAMRRKIALLTGYTAATVRQEDFMNAVVILAHAATSNSDSHPADLMNRLARLGEATPHLREAHQVEPPPNTAT